MAVISIPSEMAKVDVSTGLGSHTPLSIPSSRYVGQMSRAGCV